MSDDPNSIPLVESKSPPTPTVRRTRKNTKNVEILKMLVFIGLVVLVLVLIAALVIVLFRKCDSTKPKPILPIKPPLKVRQTNSYWNREELPNFVSPTGYEITLQLLHVAFDLTQHRQSHRFFGQVAINMTANENTKFVVLHAKNLSMLSVTIKAINYIQKPITVTEQIIDRFYDQLILVLNEPLKKSVNYSLEIVYSGNITTYESGIIRTFYRNLKLNRVSEILYSKLEPVGARRMFPCFDEPDKKALFVVRIIHLAHYTALSNMPLQRSTVIRSDGFIFQDNTVPEISKTKLSVFNSTFVYMSTYLVAFVLFEDFEVLNAERKPNFTVGIWVPKGFRDSGTVSLKYSITSENFLETYLNYSSPMPKTDHIYIPNFLSGAMENWGLITYRENHLLMSPTQGEFQSKKAYLTIAHELAHIWFGNWVTMKTWKDLWLNEGFASYFASYTYFTNLKLSTTRAEHIFLYYNRQIMDKDGKPSSYPVRMSVPNLKTIFNSYTYSKGQAMLSWLNSIMSEPKFRAGIQGYVKTYAQKSPTTDEFFAEMQKQGTMANLFDMPLNSFFAPWLNTIGYPVLTVNYDIGKEQLIISQQSVVSNSTANTTWPIYTVLKTNQVPMYEPFFFQDKIMKKSLSFARDDFVLINADGKSYLRVNYSTYLWEKIIDNIRSGNPSIDVTSKIVLFDDNFYFADNRLINMSITKSLIDTLVNETNIVPWSQFYGRIFSKIYEMFGDEIVYLKWSNYVKKLSKSVLKQALKISSNQAFNFDDEIYQRQVFLMNCEIDNGEMLDIMSQNFELWIKNPTKLPKHLTSIILYYGIKTNDKYSYWMKMWNMLTGKAPNDYVDNDQIAVGLAGTSKPYLLNKLLDYTLTPRTHASDIDKHGAFNNLMKWILQSYNGIHILRRWILVNHKRIQKFAFGDNVPAEVAQNNFETLLVQIASRTYDVNIIRPLLFLHRNKFALTNIVMNNNQWRENVGKKLLRYL